MRDPQRRLVQRLLLNCVPADASRPAPQSILDCLGRATQRLVVSQGASLPRSRVLARSGPRRLWASISSTFRVLVAPRHDGCADCTSGRPVRYGSPRLPHAAAEDLLELIMRRYERASTILTSNRPVEDWGKAARGHRRRHRVARPPAPSRPRAQVQTPKLAHQGPDSLRSNDAVK